MKINRKFSLWLFLLGMICLPNEQVEARMMSNNTMYAIACTTFGAASYLAYMMYQDYCKQQVDIEKKRIADGDRIIVSENIDLIKSLFKDEKLADDFDIRIFALFMEFFSVEKLLVIIQEMRKISHQKSEPISMKHFEDVMMQYNSDQNNEKVNATQSLLDRAYHQAAHAVALIELMNPHLALYNVSLNGTNSFSGGFLFCPLVHDVSDEDTLKVIEDIIMYYLAGGIGEQLFDVSPLPRFDDDFDMSKHDKDSDNYDYIDMVTRQSVVYNIENVVDFADMLLYFNYLDADGSDPENFIVDPADRYDLVFSLYKKIQIILARNNDKIKKLAELLVDKGTVYADEAYAICGKKRPLFYFEKK